MTKVVYRSNCLPTWHFPLLCLYWEKGVLFVTSKWFYVLFFLCFHSNAFRGRVTCLRSLQLTAEFHLLSIHCTQEGVSNMVRVHRSIYWVYGVHRDVHTRAAKVVSSMGLLQRPRRYYGDWAGYVGDSGAGECIILSWNSISESYCCFYKIVNLSLLNKPTRCSWVPQLHRVGLFNNNLELHVFKII